MMLTQYSPNGHTHPGTRPFWQLLLAAQTDQLPPLTRDECQALLDFLGDLMPEGIDAGQISTDMARCLTRLRERLAKG